MKRTTSTNLSVKWAQPTPQLEIEAASIQAKFPTVASNEADWEDFHFYSPLNIMYHMIPWALENTAMH